MLANIRTKQMNQSQPRHTRFVLNVGLSSSRRSLESPAKMDIVGQGQPDWLSEQLRGLAVHFPKRSYEHDLIILASDMLTASLKEALKE